MADTKNKIQEIKKKASNPNISLLEARNLTVELNKIFPSIMQDKEKQEERKLAIETSKTIFNVFLNSIDKWIKGEIDPSDTDASVILEQCGAYEQVGENWKFYEKNINENEKLDEDEKQEFIKLLKGSIEGLKKREAELIKLFQKRQEKHRSKKEDSDLDDSNELSPEEKKSEQKDLLDQRILGLQNQIEELKKNQNSTNPEIQQKIADLQKKEKEVQAQLDKLQNDASPRSTSSDTSSSHNKKGKSFPVWGIILIVLGVLIAAGLAAYFILEKKNRPQLKKTK